MAAHTRPGCEVIAGSRNLTIGMKTRTDWSRTGYLYAWHGSQLFDVEESGIKKAPADGDCSPKSQCLGIIPPVIILYVPKTVPLMQNKNKIQLKFEKKMRNSWKSPKFVIKWNMIQRKWKRKSNIRLYNSVFWSGGCMRILNLIIQTIFH